MDRSSQHPEPQRLSALYQYHNAPEVAPAHGLEYDDTIYPSSDKYPVLSDRIYDLKHGKYSGLAGDNKPPRIIFGMKVRTFLVVALVMILIVVGAAVGGAVGGKSLRQQDPQGDFTTSNTTTSSSPTATSTFTAATPTYIPLSDCPASNNTAYTSSFASTTPLAPNASLHFTKYCDLASPLTSTTSTRIAEAFVYSFSDCVEVCASYNYWNDNANCTVAVYEPAGSRPGNCWVGHTGSIEITSLNMTSGTDVAVLSS